MKQKRGNNFASRSGDDERKRLDVNFWQILTIALVLTVIIYALVLPIRSSYLGILLYERGYTQHLAIWFASIVVVSTIIKLIKINREFQGLKKIWISDIIKFDNPQSLEVITFQRSLARENSLIALRCSRVLAAYIQSNNRKTAAEFALDDSSFYVSNSESSYAFPRILIWAIPLLGFIGTVLGISQAVNGFNGFLDKSGDIQQIKEGIGTVTTGLAIAFDTTLLALLLSVLVMIPLVLVERYESRLLLAIDIFINDNLLPMFKEESSNLDTETINKSINQAIKQYFPNPQNLIDPAHDYAKQAVIELTQIFVNQLKEINQLIVQDGQFTSFLDNPPQTEQQLISQMNNIVENMATTYTQPLVNQKQINQNLTQQVNSLFEAIKISYTDSLANKKQLDRDSLKQVNSLFEHLKMTYAESLVNQKQLNQNVLKKLIMLLNKKI